MFSHSTGSNDAQLHSAMSRRACIAISFALCGILFAPGCASTPGASFASPDAAVQGLVSALRPIDKQKLREVLGSDSDELISSGDEIADRNRAESFLESYDQKHALVAEPNGDQTLQIGDNDWPFPIPLVESKGKWSFDTAAGKEEILNRRIGENELFTIQVCLAIADAERDYVRLDPNADGLPEYAQRLVSDPGTRNGLYWPTSDNEPPSPLGLFAAEAADEGYRRSSTGQPTPYHGYCYRLLKSQGPHAAGGAYEYIVNGHMIGGFALVAWPASYDVSGVMTFITNQDGVVFQKDLGRGTDSAAKAMTQFDPGAGWVAAEKP